MDACDVVDTITHMMALLANVLFVFVWAWIVGGIPDENRKSGGMDHSDYVPVQHSHEPNRK